MLLHMEKESAQDVILPPKSIMISWDQQTIHSILGI